MNIPYTVLRTEMFGEEDWSIAVKKEHALQVPKGFKLQEYKPGNGEINAYETQYPYTDIRYFVPDRDRLDEILCDIASGHLELKLTSPLGNTYEGVFGLKEVIVEERKHKKQVARMRRIHKQELDRLPSSQAKYKYRMLAAVKLNEEFDIVDIAQILGMSSYNVKIATGVKTESREERMVLADKRKRLSRSLYRRGTNVYEIADYLDITVETVKKYLGSMYNSNRNSDEKMETAIELLERGMQIEQVAKEMGCNRTTVYHYIRRYGKPIEYKCEKYDKAFKKKLMKAYKEHKRILSLGQRFKCNQYKIKYYLDNEA